MEREDRARPVGWAKWRGVPASPFRRCISMKRKGLIRAGRSDGNQAAVMDVTC